MSWKLRSLLFCSCLALASGCAETHDESGVDVGRAADAGYTRITFSVVAPNGDARRAGIAHDVYFDARLTVPSEGWPSHARVPEDHGELGYGIATMQGAASIDLVDLADRDERGVPATLARFMCMRSSTSGAEGSPTFDSPYQSADGSFVRVELVDLRHAHCIRML
jgi:hypothetical protein